MSGPRQVAFFLHMPKLFRMIPARILKGSRRRHDPKFSIGIDAPGKLYPEFILFPNLTGVDLLGELKFLFLPSCKFTQNRLTERDPHSAMGLIAVEIMPF